MSILWQVSAKVLMGDFYRRHAVPFGLVGIILFGLVKPAYLIFTGLFIRSILLNQQQSLVLGLLCAGFAMYATLSMVRGLRLPKHSFMLELGGQKTSARYALWAGNVLLAGAFGYVYLILMNYHALTLGFAWGWLFGGMAGMVFVFSLVYMDRHVVKPSGAIVLRRKWFQLRLRLPFLLWRLLWNGSRKAYWILKGLSMLFMLMLVSVGIAQSLPQIVELSFVLTGLMHAILVFLLRRSELNWIQWVRGLPISPLKWMRAYVFVMAFLIVPELLLLSLATWNQGTSLYWVLSFVVIGLGTQMLAFGLTFLPEMTTQDFGRLMFGLFIVAFACLIFSVPLLAVYGLLGAAGVWIGLNALLRQEDSGILS